MSCNNCGNCYKICQPFQACFSEMQVRCPVDYSENDIVVLIANAQKVSFRQTIDLTDGVGVFDLDLVSDGFFSAYGGPYTLQFFDSISSQLINFVATNGISYTCIEFEFQNGSEVDSITISA